MGNDVGRPRHRGVRSHRRTTFRRAPIALQFYADTNHNGTVDESEQEWRLRRRKPGAIIVFNCDRDGATPPELDHQDQEIVNAQELDDFTKLIVKRNSDLPADCDAFVFLTRSNALKIRGFYFFDPWKTPVIGNIIGGPTTEYRLGDIRTRDYVFGFEAVQPVKTAGEETIEIHVVIRRAHSKVFDEFVYFTIAPWLMLSNVEEGETVYVAGMPRENDGFVTNLRSTLGGRLHVIRNALEIDRWMQDIIEIGFSSTPASRRSPMHQVLNSRNSGLDWHETRLRLYEQTIKDLVNDNFGHVHVPQAGQNSLDSFGNLEVTPSLTDYPFGRIYYGVRDTAYSTEHDGKEMGANVVNFLHANKYQPPVAIPTSWLLVGHVDEFLSFVPNLNASRGEKRYKLLIASPRIATRLCNGLPTSVRNTAIICQSKGTGFALAVRNFLNSSNSVRNFNATLQNRLDEMLINIICPEFKLNNPDDIIHIPVIFNGDLGPPPLVDNAIARTGGMVNCLVVRPNVIIPKPFGPKNAAGEDIFEKYTSEQLRRLGLIVHFVDDWRTYHVLAGEIHCGTNTKRTPPATWTWWRRQTQVGGNRVHR